MKRLVGLLLVTVVPFVAATRALADKPTIQRFPVDDEFVVEDTSVLSPSMSTPPGPSSTSARSTRTAPSTSSRHFPRGRRS